MGFLKDVGEFLLGKERRASSFEPESYKIQEAAFRPGAGGIDTEIAQRRRLLGYSPSPEEEQMKIALGQQVKNELAAMAAGRGSMYGFGQSMGSVLGKSAIDRAREQSAATQAMQNYLAMQMAGRASEQELRTQQQQAYNQLVMQQALANAAGRQKEGILGGVLSAFGGGLAGGLMSGIIPSGSSQSTSQPAISKGLPSYIQYDPFKWS